MPSFSMCAYGSYCPKASSCQRSTATPNDENGQGMQMYFIAPPKGMEEGNCEMFLEDVE